MIKPPEMLPFTGDWAAYEQEVYQAFLDTFVNASIQFRGMPVRSRYRPATRGMGYSFWHTISEAPDPSNRREEDRIPDIRRCERIRWLSWAIGNAGGSRVDWWENRRGNNTHIVIWARDFDFAVVLAKRKGYYVLKTAYAEIQHHTQRKFEAELAAFHAP